MSVHQRVLSLAFPLRFHGVDCLVPLPGRALTKRIAIAAHPYGFLYSHNQDDSKSIIDTTNSNVNIFVGCNNAHTGPFLRYIAIDSAG